MEIIRKVEPIKLRGMCIKYNYYTAGSCEAYGDMLFRFNGDNITANEIEWLAQDIKDHSETKDDVVSIAYRILTEACYEYINDLDF